MLRRPPQLPAHFVALSLTAVLLALSYPLPGWSFLAWVALAPAGWLAAVSRRPWTLVWTSAIVFGVWWVWMLRWLWPVTLPGAVATAMFQSLFWVLALWATNVCVRRQRVPIVVALPLVWVSLEFVRSTWPWGGFAWFTLAQTQGNWQVESRYAGPAAQWVWLAGHHLGSLIMLLWCGSLLQVLTHWHRSGDKLIWPAKIVYFLCVWIFCSIQLVAEIRRSERLEAQYSPPGDLIAVIQTNTPHSNKLSPTAATYEEDFAALRRLHAEAAGSLTSRDREGAGPSGNDGSTPLPDGRGSSEQGLSDGDAEAPRSLTVAARQNASRQTPALIVWPETVIPGPFNEPVASQIERWALNRPDDDDGASLRARTSKPRQARELIAEFGIPTLVGSSTELATDDPRDPLQFNSATLVDEDGDVARYDKMHRVPFGEYIPLPEALKKWVLSTVSPYDFDYSIDPGQSITVFEVPAETSSGVLRFATPICFEDTNAALCREMVYDPETGEKRVDVLVNLTTNGWFGELPSDTSQGRLGWESMRYQHLQLASLRAIENRVPVVRSVNTGVSAMIDSTGRIVAAATPGTEGVVSAELVLDPRRTVYAIVGDWPIRVLSWVAALLVLFSLFRKPRLIRRRRKRLASA